MVPRRAGVPGGAALALDLVRCTTAPCRRRVALRTCRRCPPSARHESGYASGPYAAVTFELARHAVPTCGWRLAISRRLAIDCGTYAS